MNTCMTITCATCELDTDCRIGYSNRHIQPIHFSCPHCHTQLEIILDISEAPRSNFTFNGCKPSKHQPNGPFSGANPFVDLHLDFPVKFGGYVPGATPWFASLEQVKKATDGDSKKAYEMSQFHAARLHALNQLYSRADELKRIINLYHGNNKQLFQRRAAEYLEEDEKQSLLPQDLNATLYRVIAKAFFPFVVLEHGREISEELPKMLYALDSAALSSFIEEIFSTGYINALQRDCLRVYPKIFDAELSLRPALYEGLNITEMSDLINMAAYEMQSNCDLNTRVGVDKKLAHFVVSYNQVKPSEAVLRDTEDSMFSVMALDENHFATFLHNDNGYWHLHIFVSRIEKGSLHRGNALWHDQINRDKVCREVETRHNLLRDNGLHKVDDLGQLVEIPREERRAKRNSNPLSVSDRARTTEIYSGEKSFQTWANEIRIGDRLQHAKSWQDLHAAAAAYGCELKPKGAGYVIVPVGEKGGIQLSKIGLKNLTAKFGVFQNAEPGQQAQPETTYKPSATQAKAASHYDQWSVAKDTFKPIKTAQINEQRELHKKIRKDLQAQHKADLAKIRAARKGQERFVAVSVAKMEHAIALANLADQLAHNRHALHKQLADRGPGNTFRDYLLKEATKGDEHALVLAQKYGAQEATKVARQRESDHLQIVAAATGSETKLAQRTRLNFTHRVERNGTVIYDLGRGRMITDSAISRQVQLNNIAASSPEAISTALQFASARFGRTLTLYGTQEFQRLAVEIAVKKGLAVNFADPTLDAYREKLLLDKQQIAFNHRKQQSLTLSQKTKVVNHIQHEAAPAEEFPMKVIEPAVNPLQLWMDENPDMKQTYLLEGQGKVLHVLSDGRWIQNKGRGNFAVQPSTLGVQLQVGNNVFVGKNGSVELLSDKSKLAR